MDYAKSLKQLPDIGVFTDRWSVLREQVRLRSKLLFDQPAFLHVRIIRISNKLETNQELAATIKEEPGLEQCLRGTKEDRFCILSLHQEFSLAPMRCTNAALDAIIREWKVAPDFLDVFLKFGNQRLIFEDSSGFKQMYLFPDGSFEISYQLIYVEPNGRVGTVDPWSIRQTGLHHQYHCNGNSSRIILLHPLEHSEAQKRIEGYVKFDGQDGNSILAQHPLNVHLVIISTCIVHWFNHNESLAKELDQIRRKLLAIQLKSHQVDPGELQRLRYLEDKIINKECRCLERTRSLLLTLITLNNALPSRNDEFEARSMAIEQELRMLDYRVECLSSAADTLGQRTQATLALLANILEMQNQGNSNNIQNHMLKLTRENVDDNATVKFITICTMIYLPGSFMATLLGMNLFDFASEGGSFRVSRSFWIYIALTLPLTLATVGSYWYFKKRHDYRRRKLHDVENMTAVVGQ